MSLGGRKLNEIAIIQELMPNKVVVYNPILPPGIVKGLFMLGRAILSFITAKNIKI